METKFSRLEQFSREEFPRTLRRAMSVLGAGAVLLTGTGMLWQNIAPKEVIRPGKRFYIGVPFPKNTRLSFSAKTEEPGMGASFFVVWNRKSGRFQLVETRWTVFSCPDTLDSVALRSIRTETIGRRHVLDDGTVIDNERGLIFNPDGTSIRGDSGALIDQNGTLIKPNEYP